MKTLRVSITETSRGSVVVNVPDNATEDEIYNAAYEAYTNGNAYFGDSDFDTTNWEEE